MKKKIFIIEDDVPQAKILCKYLEYHNFLVKHSTSTKGVEDILASGEYEIVLVDWHLPGEKGLDFIARVKERFPFTQFIMITAFGTIERAVEAMKAGAYQYLTKPVNLEELLVIIEKAYKEIKLEKEVEILKSKIKGYKYSEMSNLIAESSKMKEVLILAQKVASTDVTVLILGESGTGKEIIGDLIQSLSARKNNPFLKINCAAIPEGLLESELFGHEKGAFTGADRLKLGLFEMASSGTIFLDEIGDMALPLQSKLLRVLQDGAFLRVGGTKEIKVDVRIIAATNRNLTQMVENGSFREDLYWRLSVFPIKIPPLRERREDIMPLVSYFLKQYSQRVGKNVDKISRDGAEKLMGYNFPGNIRELEHIIERAVILSENNLITVDDLMLGESVSKATPCSVDSISNDCPLWKMPLPDSLRLLETKRIQEALSKSGNIKTKAAELLGISERTLRYKLEKNQEETNLPD